MKILMPVTKKQVKDKAALTRSLGKLQGVIRDTDAGKLMKKGGKSWEESKVS